MGWLGGRRAVPDRRRCLSWAWRRRWRGAGLPGASGKRTLPVSLPYLDVRGSKSAKPVSALPAEKRADDELLPELQEEGLSSVFSLGEAEPLGKEIDRPRRGRQIPNQAASLRLFHAPLGGARALGGRSGRRQPCRHGRPRRTSAPLSPRLAPGAPNPARFSPVSATSRQVPSRLISREPRHHAPLLARVAIGRSGASPSRVRACEMPPCRPPSPPWRPTASAAPRGYSSPCGAPAPWRDRPSPCRQVALARPAGLDQHLMHPLRRHRPGDHAEADLVAEANVSREAGRNTGHGCRFRSTKGAKPHSAPQSEQRWG